MTDHKLPPNLGEAALQGVEDVASLVAEVQRLKMALQNIANTLDSADDASMRVAHRMAKGMALTAVSATPARPTSAQRPPPSVSLPRPMVQRPDTSLPPPVASDDPFAATTPLPFPASSVSEVAAPMAPMAYEARRPAASQSPGDTQPALARDRLVDDAQHRHRNHLEHLETLLGIENAHVLRRGENDSA